MAACRAPAFGGELYTASSPAHTPTIGTCQNPDCTGPDRRLGVTRPHRNETYKHCRDEASVPESQLPLAVLQTQIKPDNAHNKPQKRCNGQQLCWWRRRQDGLQNGQSNNAFFAIGSTGFMLVSRRPVPLLLRVAHPSRFDGGMYQDFHPGLDPLLVTFRLLPRISPAFS